MKIGIIGSGNIGGTLTRRLAALGHEVFVANSRGPESLAALAKETGAKAATPSQATRAGEVVVVTIPEAKIKGLPKDLFAGVPRDVVVIDTGNYYPRQRDGRIAEIEEGMTESRWVEHQLGRPVVKAFNNIYAQHLMDLGRPAGGLRIALPVAGDDAYAKAVVLHLVEELGPGGNSPAHPCTPPISMPRACGARSPRQATSGHRSGEPRRTAPAISRVPPDGGAML